uniref:Uncharacterized protein n=1 Tax=Arion vulgaris TaxID=1028688 RepID=A0A0B6YAX4_9EUPU
MAGYCTRHNYLVYTFLSTYSGFKTCRTAVTEQMRQTRKAKHHLTIAKFPDPTVKETSRTESTQKSSTHPQNDYNQEIFLLDQ